MLCKTLHDFCEMACNSGRGSFPAPAISRSITNFGIAFPPFLNMHARKLRWPIFLVLRRRSRLGNGLVPNFRDLCPVTARPVSCPFVQDPRHGLERWLDIDVPHRSCRTPA